MWVVAQRWTYAPADHHAVVGAPRTVVPCGTHRCPHTVPRGSVATASPGRRGRRQKAFPRKRMPRRPCWSLLTSRWIGSVVQRWTYPLRITTLRSAHRALSSHAGPIVDHRDDVGRRDPGLAERGPPLRDRIEATAGTSGLRIGHHRDPVELLELLPIEDHRLGGVQGATRSSDCPRRRTVPERTDPDIVSGAVASWHVDLWILGP